MAICRKQRNLGVNSTMSNTQKGVTSFQHTFENDATLLLNIKKDAIMTLNENKIFVYKIDVQSQSGITKITAFSASWRLAESSGKFWESGILRMMPVSKIDATLTLDKSIYMYIHTILLILTNERKHDLKNRSF